MRFITKVALGLAVFVLGTSFLSAADRLDWKKVKVLVYTRNGQGYVHDNIPSAVASIQRLGKELGFIVDATDQPTAFTNSNLANYALLIFPSTNNDVFDNNEQRLALRRYIESGGGLVGIHSAVGTERNWPWFKKMIGGKFSWHPKFQKYRVLLIDPQHPSARGLPKVWERTDECYIVSELYPGIHAFFAQDLTSINDDREKIKDYAGSYSDLFPAAWSNDFDGGHVWVTALGHSKTDYSDPIYVQHIRQGIAFVAARSLHRDPKRAYATSFDEPVRY